MRQQNRIAAHSAPAGKVQESFDDTVVVPGAGTARGKNRGNGHDDQARGGLPTIAEVRDNRGQGPRAEGAESASAGQDEGADGEGLLDLVSQRKPFDAASFAAADAAQGWRATACSSRCMENYNGLLLTKSFQRRPTARRSTNGRRRVTRRRRGRSAPVTRSRSHPRSSPHSRPRICSAQAEPVPHHWPRCQGPPPRARWCSRRTGTRCRRPSAIWRATGRSIGGSRACLPPGAAGDLGNRRGHQGLAREIREKQRRPVARSRACCRRSSRSSPRGCYARPSASAGVRDTRTGVMLPSGAKHVFFVAEDGADIPRSSEVLFKRLVLAGYGFLRIAKDGTTEVRSLIDRRQRRAERLWYDAEPVLFDAGTASTWS